MAATSASTVNCHFDAQGSGGGLTIVARDILLDVPRGLHSQLGADLVWRQSEPCRDAAGKSGDHRPTSTPSR